MCPRRYCLARYTGPLGGMVLASEGAALVGVWFEKQRHFPAAVAAALAAGAAGLTDAPPLRMARVWLDSYFSGSIPAPAALPPLAPAGTPFQQAVWRLLQRIPYGHTTTYGHLAEQLRCGGIRAAAQAVGGAVGRNPISLLIPCHRVVGAAGTLTGYAAGLPAKTYLLRLENILP